MQLIGTRTVTKPKLEKHQSEGNKERAMVCNHHLLKAFPFCCCLVAALICTNRLYFLTEQVDIPDV